MLVVVAAVAGAAAAPEPMWIDTDAACGSSAFADADDCWALALALRSDKVAVRGISAVTGAVKAGEAARLAGEVARRFGHDGEVHQGAVRKNHRPTAASRALAAALERERLSIVALGPLTNVAALLVNRPELAARIARVVAVFGTPPDSASADGLADYRNYNAAADTKSVAALMRTEVELVVVPLDAGRAAVLTDAALDAAAGGGAEAAWLAAASRGWLHVWRDRIGEAGAFPAAGAAVAYLTDRELLDCRPTRARFAWKHSFFREKSVMPIGDAVEGGRPIVYCGTAAAALRDRLLGAVIAAGGS